MINEFETAWANRNGYKYGVACNSGTNALFLALKSLGIGKGDEVILPEFTMIATAWAVTYTGAKPVFVDCKDDLTIDIDKIVITKKTKAIIPVPIYGREYEKFTAPVPIVEDMAEAHGLQPHGKIACYSFYKNKIIETQEGGMCLTNSKKLADEMRLLANMYFDKKRTLIHPKIGYNFRMTPMQAQYGLKQVLCFDKILKRRKQIEMWYDEVVPEEMKMPPRDVLWMYDIQTDRQEELKRYLKDYEVRYFFKPMSMQPMYLGEYKHLKAYKWSKKGLYLPTYPKITKKEIQKIGELLWKFTKKK